MNKPKIKIESIQVFAQTDDNPDTSYFGEYTNKESTWCIDRASGEFCKHIRQRERIIERLHDKLDDHADETDTPEYAALLEKTKKRIEKIRNSGAVEIGSIRREYSFSLPSNHIPHNSHNWDHVQGEAREKVIKEYGSIKNADLAYAMQDYNRMEGLYAGDWQYIGIIAKAKILIPSNIPQSAQYQTISSGGLCGIESDGGEEYLDEIVKDELSSLANQLEALGFGKRAIQYAIKNRVKEIIYK